MNSVTEYTTHEVAETNFAMSEKINEKVTNRLLVAAKDESILNSLWTPAKSDAVVMATA